MNILKLLLAWLLEVLGINALCRLTNRHKALILFYHGICSEGFHLLKGYDERQLAGSVFGKHLEYLRRKGYVFTSMTELAQKIKNKDNIGRAVVLTFDDGFENVVQNAYPLMQKYGARGCFYLVSDLVGETGLLWTDYIETVVRNQKKGDFQFIFRGETIRYLLNDKSSYENAMRDIKTKLRSVPDRVRHEHLEQFKNNVLSDIPKEFRITTWGQISSLDMDILEIGSHTRKHPNCVNLTSNDELEDEIKNSKVNIEAKTGRRIKHFCYPAGSFNDRVISKVAEYGYETAVTTVPGFVDANSDLFRLKRIEASEQLLLFKASVSGSYYTLRRIKARLT